MGEWVHSLIGKIMVSKTIVLSSSLSGPALKVLILNAK